MRYLRTIEDAACVLALLLTCAVLLHDLSSTIDLPSWDEADYLRRGLSIGARGLPDAEWGPLYSLWYAALGLLMTDRVALHDFSYAALIVLPSVLIYATARRLRAPPVIALAGALLFTLSQAAQVNPRPSLLALVVVLCALLIATARRDTVVAFAAIGLGMLIASFARPELFVSFLVVSALLVPVAWRKRALRTVCTYGLTAVLLLIVLGNPFADKTGRRFYAFCQHYALGEVERAALPLHPWHQCTEVVQRSFGDVDNVGAALRANPSALAAHVLRNAEEYPLDSARLFVPGLEEHGEAFGAQSRHSLIAAALAVSLLWLAFSVARGRGRLVVALKDPRVLAAAVTACAVLVPSLASSLLLHPREHYLVLQGVFVPLMFVAFAAAARSAVAEERFTGERVLSGAVVVAALVACPQLALGDDGRPSLPNRQVVATLRALPLRDEVRILELQGGYDAYAGPRFVRVYAMERETDEPFDTFLRRRGVGVVVIEPKLRSHPTLRDAAAFEAFLDDPGPFGFETYPVRGTNRIIAVQRRPAVR